MALVNYTYYTGSYLLGRSAALTWENFPYWEGQAEAEVNYRTMGRAASLRKPPRAVLDCICELAELKYQADALQQSALASGAAGPLASFSNDGESGSYELSQSDFTAEGAARKTQEILRKYLAPLGLLYAGVGVMQ